MRLHIDRMATESDGQNVLDKLNSSNELSSTHGFFRSNDDNDMGFDYHVDRHHSLQISSILEGIHEAELTKV